MPESSDALSREVEEHLTRLLEGWAQANRLPPARAISIREAAQAESRWEQQFWTRISLVLLRTTAAIQPVPVKSWGPVLHIETDQGWAISQEAFAAFNARPYLGWNT